MKDDLENPMVCQLNFLNEIEKLKVVYRRNKVIDGSRFENSAEHSWHVAMMALVLLEYGNTEQIDILKVLKMLLLHDLVEVYAGDTWIYDPVGTATQSQKELAAADKLFGLLPSEQRDEFHRLWEEFEQGESIEASYATAIDALQPLTNHLLTGKASDLVGTPTKLEVIQRKQHIAKASAKLWLLAQTLIDASTELGLYSRLS